MRCSEISHLPFDALFPG